MCSCKGDIGALNIRKVKQTSDQLLLLFFIDIRTLPIIRTFPSCEAPDKLISVPAGSATKAGDH